MEHILLNLTLLEQSLPLLRTIVTYAEKYNDNGTEIEAYKNTTDDAKPVSSETPGTDTIIMVPLKLCLVQDSWEPLFLFS